MRSYIYYLYLLLAFFIVFTSRAESQFFYKLPVYLRTIENDRFDELVLGVHDSATNKLDLNLGEEAIPPFTPPSGLHAYFDLEYYDSTILEVPHSYLDLRPIPAVAGDSSIYTMVVQNIIDSLTVSWPKMGTEIDSAVITDLSNNKIDMKLTNSFTKFYFPTKVTYTIKIWFNKKALPVDEDKPILNSDISKIEVNGIIYDNTIRFDSPVDNARYRLMTIAGNELANGVVHIGQNTIDIGMASAGAYMLIISSDKGRVCFTKIIKL